MTNLRWVFYGLEAADSEQVKRKTSQKVKTKKSVVEAGQVKLFW